MAKVELLSVNKVYPNGFHAVKDVSLTIDDGEFMVLVGPSGCAKSTTLNMAAGLEEISSGEVRIDGRVVNDLSAKDRDIAMVFQSYALYPHMNVFDNMAFGLKLRKAPKAEIKRRVEEAAELLDITDFLERKPKALSGGQRQRVALGRAIVRDPKVFLFDEPLSNLDAKLRAQMRVELAKLHAKLKATVIYVTHDQVEAMTMGDRICVMNQGRVEQVDAPVRVYTRPNSEFVATFIGSPTMNIARVTLKQEGEGVMAVLSGGHALPLAAEDAKAVAAHVGDVVHLGLRPEHIQLVRGGETEQPVIRAKAEFIERMGSEAFIYFHLGEQQFVAAAPAETDIRPGAEMNLAVNMGKRHLFHAESGESLLAAGAA